MKQIHIFLKPWNHAKLHGSEIKTISGLTEKTNLSLSFSLKKTIFSLMETIWMKHYFLLEYVLSVNTLDKTHLSQKERRACIINCIMYEDQC